VTYLHTNNSPAKALKQALAKGNPARSLEKTAAQWRSPMETNKAETSNSQNTLPEPSNLRVNRRQMLKGAGMFLGTGGALATLAMPAEAEKHNAEEDADEIVGLWRTVVSAPDNSFPAFPAFEVWSAGGTFTGSGQPDLTPAALASTAWGAWNRVGKRRFHLVARFWTYNPDASPSGFASVDFLFTLSKDGNAYHGEGPTQFFDNNGSPLGPPSATFDDGTRVTL
jgi:hypothetical protein